MMQLLAVSHACSVISLCFLHTNSCFCWYWLLLEQWWIASWWVLWMLKNVFWFISRNHSDMFLNSWGKLTLGQVSWPQKY